MQVPPEGSSKAEYEAQWSGSRVVQAKAQMQQQQTQPPSLPQQPSEQQHPPPQPPTDTDDIPVRVLSELPLAGSQAVLQPDMPSGQSGTFSRLAVGWSPSNMWLARPGDEGSECSAHDPGQRPGDITSSGIFKRLESMQPLRGIDGFNTGT